MKLAIVHRIACEKHNSALVRAEPRNAVQGIRLKKLYELLVVLRILLTLNLQSGWIHQDEFHSLEVITGDYFDLQVFKCPGFNSSFPTKSIPFLHLSIYVPYCLTHRFLSGFHPTIQEESIPNPEALLLVPRLIQVFLSFLLDYILLKFLAIQQRTPRRKVEDDLEIDPPQPPSPPLQGQHARLITLASSQVMLVFVSRTHAALLNVIFFAILLCLVSESIHRMDEYLPILNEFHAIKPKVRETAEIQRIIRKYKNSNKESGQEVKTFPKRDDKKSCKENTVAENESPKLRPQNTKKSKKKSRKLGKKTEDFEKLNKTLQGSSQTLKKLQESTETMNKTPQDPSQTLNKKFQDSTENVNKNPQESPATVNKNPQDSLPTVIKNPQEYLANMNKNHQDSPGTWNKKPQDSSENVNKKLQDSPQNVNKTPRDSPATVNNPEGDPARANKPEDDPERVNKPEDDPARVNNPEDDPAQMNNPEGDPATVNNPEGDPARANKPEDDPERVNKPEDDPARVNNPEDDPAQMNNPEEDPAQMNKREEDPARVNKLEDPARVNNVEDDPELVNKKDQNMASSEVDESFRLGSESSRKDEPVSDKMAEELEKVREKVGLWKELKAFHYSPIENLHWICVVVVCGIFNDPDFLLSFACVPIFFYLQRGMSNSWIGMTQFHLRLFMFLLYMFFMSIPFIVWDSFYHGRVSMRDLNDLNLNVSSFVITPVNYFINKASSIRTLETVVWILANFCFIFNVLAFLAFLSISKEIYSLLFEHWRDKPKISSQWTFLNCTWLVPLLILVQYKSPFDLVPLIFPLVILHGHKIILVSRFSWKLGLLWFGFNLVGVIFWGYWNHGGIVSSFLEIGSQLTPHRFNETHADILLAQMAPLPPIFILTIPSTWKTILKSKYLAPEIDITNEPEPVNLTLPKKVLKLEQDKKVRVFHLGVSHQPICHFEQEMTRILGSKDPNILKVNLVLLPRGSESDESAFNCFKTSNLTYVKTYWNHWQVKWPFFEEQTGSRTSVDLKWSDLIPKVSQGLNLYRFQGQQSNEPQFETLFPFANDSFTTCLMQWILFAFTAFLFVMSFVTFIL